MAYYYVLYFATGDNKISHSHRTNASLSHKKTLVHVYCLLLDDLSRLYVSMRIALEVDYL